MSKDRYDTIKVITGIILLYLFLELVLHITCPIRFLTGISCAGCGMSRAWLSLLRGDIHKAFYYHPLFWTIPFILIVYFLRNKITVKVLHILEVLIIILFLGTWLYRFTIPNQDIVVFEPWNSFPAEIMQYITGFYLKGFLCIVLISHIRTISRRTIPICL